MLYDPIKRHLAIEKLITRAGPNGLERKYYRIRPARWYGGIITADCVGCGLLCRFCWVSDAVMFHPAEVGRMYTPRMVAGSLISLARKRNLSLLRISGGEPTIGKLHLLQLLDNLRGKGYRFILETNGIPIAYDEGYASDLSKYDFIHVRVSLKGCNEHEFSALTGARPDGFRLQLRALEMLVDAGVSCHPSVMASFSPKESFVGLVKRLEGISTALANDVEVEELILYPHVVKRVRAHGLKYYTAYAPDSVSPEQV